jgi:FMN phosphatase YigB (HAD superfamily)
MPTLITDLDNTLYDWTTYYAKAFTAMVISLAVATGISRERLLDEFRQVHRKHKTIEPPYAIIELPSVIGYFGDIPRSSLIDNLKEPIQSFESARRRYLKPFANVAATLTELKERGCKIVGFTESLSVNAYDRLEYLGLLGYFDRVYAAATSQEIYLAENPKYTYKFKKVIRELPPYTAKPNPATLCKILIDTDTLPSDAIYVGDCLTKDILMANSIGIPSIWARYGNNYDRSLDSVIARVTHWSKDDFRLHSSLLKKKHLLKPDLVVDAFDELLPILQTADSLTTHGRETPMQLDLGFGAYVFDNKPYSTKHL